MIQFSQYSNSSKISSMATLSASFRKIRSKRNELFWWQGQTESFFSNQGDITLRLMIQFSHYSNSSKISSMATLSASFRKIRSKRNELFWWQSQTGYFPQQSRRYWPPYLQVLGRSNENWTSYADDKVTQRLFSNQGDVILRLMIRSGQVSNVRELIHAHLICQFQADPIKSGCYADYKVKQKIFSNQGGITLRLMIMTELISFRARLRFSMSALSANFRKMRSKLNELLWWQSQTEAFFSNQGDVTLRFMVRSGQFSNSFEILSVSILSASFRNIRLKLKEL